MQNINQMNLVYKLAYNNQLLNTKINAKYASHQDNTKLLYKQLLKRKKKKEKDGKKLKKIKKKKKKRKLT